MLTLEKFEEASEVVKRVAKETKLLYSKSLSQQVGNKVYFKPENMQHTGAYKLRGAYYKISTLTDEERAKGLITASAGNHAQGVAYAAKAFGCKATIVMPSTTPLMKVERTKRYGADVVLYGDVYDEACEYAYKLADEHGYTFIHPFDDLAVATGQGTIAMEIIQELPLVDYILVPVGGGGLATGVSTLAKMLNPNIKVNSLCLKYGEDTANQIDLTKFDYIVDCIDDIKAKKLLILKAKEHKIPLLCAMGAGNRYQGIPNFEIADISKTSYDPIAKILRKFCAEQGIKKLNVCYTKQKATKFDCKTIGSMVYYVVNMATVMCAKVINDILN